MRGPHVLMITHTHERVARSLLGLRAQTAAPASVTVACDGSIEQLREEVLRATEGLACEVLLVMRPHQGEGRRAQNRNNAVRARLDAGLEKDAPLVFLDGDCIPEREALAVHLRALDRHDLSLGHAVRMDAEQSAALLDERIRGGGLLDAIRPEQLAQARKAQRRARRRVWERRLGLGKPHKPPIQSGNFGVRAGALLAVNGFDEAFVGWGAEDDDLSRRLYASGARPQPVCDGALVAHQWHPSEAPARWKEGPNAHRLASRVPTRCQRGIENPAPQPDPEVTVLRP